MVLSVYQSVSQIAQEPDPLAVGWWLRIEDVNAFGLSPAARWPGSNPSSPSINYVTLSNFLTSLCLHFIICKMGMTVVPLSEGVAKIKVIIVAKDLA